MATKDDLLDALPDDIPLKELRPLEPTALVVAESRRVEFHVRLPAGTTFEEILIPDYWRVVSRRLHPSAIIEVEPADSSWHATLLVREVSQEHAKVALLHKVDLPPLYGATVDDLPLGTSVSFLGPMRLWGCFRGTTILRHSFATKGDAVQWLRESAS